MDSGVNPLRERARFKFCVSVWGVVSCKGACQFTRPQSESIFVFICLHHGARWWVQSASAVYPMMCIEVLETNVACMFFVQYSLEYGR